MPTYLWQCEICSLEMYVYSKIDERDCPPSKIANTKCGHTWVRKLTAPRVLKESFPDGHRLKNDQGFSNYAKAAQLEVDKLDYKEKSVERKEMQTEINRLKGVKTSEGKK